MRRIVFAALLMATALGSMAWANTKDDSVELLQSSANVLTEIMDAPDKGIPEEVLYGAKCIAVVPHLINAGFMGGGKHRRGVVSCRTSSGWSAPAFISVGGGSWGLQVSAEGIDLVMLIMNNKGWKRLLSTKFQVSGEGSAAAGPVGRHASADTDWKMNAEVLTYSRSRGAFAGLTLEGAVVEEDVRSNTTLYGKNVMFSDVLTGRVTPPAAAAPFVRTVERAGVSRREEMVWVDTTRGVYHKQETQWYVQSDQGKYMTEADAIKAGYKPAEMIFTDPVWNVWTEQSSTLSFKPHSLQRGQEFSLVVNLAALGFRQLEGGGVYSQAVSGSLGDWIKRNSDTTSADLEVLVIPDQRYVQMLGPRVKPIHIELKKLREAQRSGFKFDSSPLDYLRSHGGTAPFSFGTQLFRLKAVPNAPFGNAPVALSIWANGRPIDEVALNLCVAAKPEDTCSTTSESSKYSLRGADLSGNGKLPDAALHLIERGGDVVGVFRCNSCVGGEYLTWTIGQQAGGWLSDRVSELVLHLTPPVPNQNYFTQTGDVLYNLIFPNSKDADEAAAEKAFEDFFSSAHAKEGTEMPSSLFVRLLSDKPGLALFPMGLMRVPVSDGSKYFLGFDVNIEAPLEFQDYSVPPKCISKWVLFVPPAGLNDSLGDLTDARDYASSWIDRMTKSCPDCTYSDPGRFSEWLLEKGMPDGGLPEHVPPPPGEALVILSQYKNNSFFFNGSVENPPSVPSGSIRRNFATPSFAMLDACGTAAPGGSEFIRALNSHGVSSIISTSTAIAGPMAGQFLKIFMELLTKHPDYSVGRARYDAVKLLGEVHGSNGKPYGPQALVFTLVGNGSLRLCMPSQ